MNTDYIIIALLVVIILQKRDVDKSLYYFILNIPRKIARILNNA